MNTIEVCLTPELLHLHDVTHKTVVVVDILRATSSMVTAFAYGVEKIMPVAQIEDCLALQHAGYLIAGERNGEKVAGFDFGNSPLAYQQASIQGKWLAMTTTNGTLTIEKCKAARQLLIGSFLNLKAVADFLTQQAANVLIVCAGWKGHINLEDTLFAGALAEYLSSHYHPKNDAALAAHILYRSAQDDPLHFLSQSSHVQRLQRLNSQWDVEFCLRRDLYDVVPQLQNEHLVVLTTSYPTRSH